MRRAAAVLLLALLAPRPGLAAPTLVLDADTGALLHGEAIDQPWPTASLAKLMTLYVAFEEVAAGRLALDETLVASSSAAAQPPTRLGLGPGDRVDVLTALQALPVVSANDAAVLVAERISGSQEAFARRMTQEARRLGMANTRFGTANGLPAPESRTTARDMGTLARAIRANFPDLAAAILSAQGLDWRGIHYSTVNGFLASYPGADGMKTGFTCAAGYNLVASAARDGRHLIAVLLGRPSRGIRSGDAATLMRQGFADKLRFDAGLAAAAPAGGAGAVGNPDCPAWTPGEVAVMAPVPSGRSVSLGIFPTLSRARQATAQARRALPGTLAIGAPGYVLDRLPGRPTAYRAVLGGLAGDRAVAVCAALRRAGRFCTVETADRLRAQARR